MERYGIKEAEKVLKNRQNGVVLSTMEQCAMCFMLVPTMKPLD